MDERILDKMGRGGLFHTNTCGLLFAALFAIFEIKARKGGHCNCEINPGLINRLIVFIREGKCTIGEPTEENKVIAGKILQELRGTWLGSKVMGSAKAYEEAAQVLEAALMGYLGQVETKSTPVASLEKDLTDGRIITEVLKIIDDTAVNNDGGEKVVATLEIVKSRIKALVPASLKRPLS